MSEKVRVRNSPTRCPYCHDDVIADAQPWLACAGCLARHHEECWREAGRCGTCGDTRPAGAVRIAAAAPPVKALPPLGREVGLFLLCFLLLGLATTGVAVAAGGVASILGIAWLAMIVWFYRRNH